MSNFLSDKKMISKALKAKLNDFLANRNDSAALESIIQNFEVSGID